MMMMISLYYVKLRVSLLYIHHQHNSIKQFVIQFAYVELPLSNCLGPSSRINMARLQPVYGRVDRFPARSPSLLLGCQFATVRRNEPIKSNGLCPISFVSAFCILFHIGYFCKKQEQCFRCQFRIFLSSVRNEIDKEQII